MNDATPQSHALNGVLAPLNNGQPLTNGANGANGTRPIDSSPSIDIKIDIKESDVRHEPRPVKKFLDLSENASTMPQAGTPPDPSTIPLTAPQGTSPPPEGDLLQDVRLAEESNHVNGSQDVAMGSPDPGDITIELNGASTAHTPNDDAYDDDDKPPPAKRARKHSDADIASIAHSATPPPASASPAVPEAYAPTSTTSSTPHSPSGPSTLSNAQFRFCQSTIRQLKKMKDSGPFLRPVDPVALNIPHYPSIIVTPMDFSTIERKLTSSNPAKPDPNPKNPRYYNADEFVADVRLIFHNCLTFNGPDHLVTAMGKRVEEVFDKQVKHMPAPLEIKPPVVKKPVTPPPPPPPPPSVPPKKTQPARRASTSVPVIRRSDTSEVIGRPKREIHPPPPKDLPYAEAPKKHRKSKRVKDDGSVEQLRFCAKVLQDLHRKQHYGIANPFYEPVDWVKLEIPSYPKVVKKPMDMSTMKRKLENQEYPTAQKFYDDFKLMIRNCFSFNPAGTPVNQAGIELQRLFDDKWKNLPPLHDVSEDDEEEDEDDSEEERQPYAGTIAMMESQIETMRGSIAALKSSKPPKEKKEKKKRDKAPVASSSKGTAKQPKVLSKKKGKKPVADDDVLTFEQKKDLSESIGTLDGAKLERVIQIIHEGVPEIRDSTEEIELEIDLLPAAVLTKLYNFVLRPLRAPPTKRNRTVKGTGTGGLKRKSMDEDAEAEKIRQLEERMALFEQGASGASAAPAQRRDDLSEHSSDSSSGSDTSGSDSE